MSQHDKIQLDLPVLLPEIPAEEDACVRRLIASIKGQEGVQDAHVKRSVNGMSKLCIHFNARIIPLYRVEDLARMAGADITDQFGHVLFQTRVLRNVKHSLLIESKISACKGVLVASVSMSGVVRVEFDKLLTNDVKLKNEIVKCGIAIERELKSERAGLSTHKHREEEPEGEVFNGLHEGEHEHGSGSDHKHSHETGFLGERAELFFAVFAGLCLCADFAIQFFLKTLPGFSVGFYLTTYFFGGFFACLESFENLRAKRFEIDSLMIVAAIGAGILGQFLEGALLLTLFSIGHALEHYAMGKAKKAIQALAELTPKSAHLLSNRQTVDVPVEQLKVGDTVRVKPNERLPVDGFVVEGASTVNQAPVTGESVPVEKMAAPAGFSPSTGKNDPRFTVFAGSINGSGLIDVSVSKAAGDSTLARVARMVAEAQTAASPTQQFTERLERYFVPVVFGTVFLLLFAFLVRNEPFSASLYRAMAVLVAASPCALAISTPSAVLSGIARAGRSGVLIKSGAALENLGSVKAVAFDKTGTLTAGKPLLTDVVTEQGAQDFELLIAAGALESNSDHPLAQAVVIGVADRLKNVSLPNVFQVESMTGKGIRGRVAGKEVIVAKPKFFTDERKDIPISDRFRNEVRRLQDSGCTLMLVSSEKRMLGALGFMDTPRASAKSALADLAAQGVRQTVMISGDNQKVATAVAEAVGIQEAIGDLMPADKVSTIQKLRDKYGSVAMVGDGVNDAPAMAAASVGIAMGAAGSEVALEAADVALMTDDLNRLGFAVALSRKASGIIKQNLWISIGMVVVLIPATISGLGIGPAVVLHEGSTLIVVFNALRLLGFRNDQ